MWVLAQGDETFTKEQSRQAFPTAFGEQMQLPGSKAQPQVERHLIAHRGVIQEVHDPSRA